MGNGIFFIWNYDFNMICDYVIKWCNLFRSEFCFMDWKKVFLNSIVIVIEFGKRN